MKKKTKTTKWWCSPSFKSRPRREEGLGKRRGSQSNRSSITRTLTLICSSRWWSCNSNKNNSKCNYSNKCRQWSRLFRGRWDPQLRKTKRRRRIWWVLREAWRFWTQVRPMHTSDRSSSQRCRNAKLLLRRKEEWGSRSSTNNPNNSKKNCQCWVKSSWVNSAEINCRLWSSTSNSWWHNSRAKIS